MKQIFLITSIFCVAGLWPTAPSQADQEKTKLEQNKAIVRGYMNEIINKGNVAAFDTYFSEKVLFNNSEGLKQALTSMLGVIRSAFPDYNLTIEDQISEGDKVVTRVTFRGTHQGQYRGIAPTGKQVKYSGFAIDRIARDSTPNNIGERSHWKDEDVSPVANVDSKDVSDEEILLV